MLKALKITLVILSAVVAGLIVLAVTLPDSGNKSTFVTPTPEASTTQAKGGAVPPPSDIKKPVTVREGTWEVGTDIKAGKYKTPGAEDGVIEFCSWSVQKGDDYVDFGSSGESDAQGLVTLKNGQVFETNGCQPWVLVK